MDFVGNVNKKKGGGTMSNEENAYSRGCLIIFKSRFWGATTKLDSEQLGDLPEDIVKASRDLLTDDSKLVAVRGIIGESKRFIKANTMSFPIPNVDFINKSRITHVDEGLKARKIWLEEAVEELNASLEFAKQRYQERYPDLYNAGDYPTPAQLVRNLVFEWKFRVISPPGKDMAILSPEMYEQEVASFKKDMKEFEDSLISIVAKEFYERIDKLKEQCLGGTDISAATVKSVHGVLDKFNRIWDGCVQNDELTKMIQDVKMYMQGTETQMLKADDEFRRMVGKKMSEVTSLIKSSKDERLTRKLDFA